VEIFSAPGWFHIDVEIEFRPICDDDIDQFGREPEYQQFCLRLEEIADCGSQADKSETRRPISLRRAPKGAGSGVVGIALLRAHDLFHTLAQRTPGVPSGPTIDGGADSPGYVRCDLRGDCFFAGVLAYPLA